MSAAVPYQAYRSKRHSRSLSAIPPNVPPPALSGDWDTEKPAFSVNGLSSPPLTDDAVPSSPSSSSLPKKSSTFRRLQPPTRPLLPSSPLRPPQPTVIRQLDPSSPSPPTPSLHSRVPSVRSAISDSSLSSPSPSRLETALLLPPQPPPASVSSSLSPSPIVSPPLSTSPLPSRSSAPYRPGFQPKGVYRPRTDEFFQARKTNHDATRIERTKLERRLEKLIHLHFPLQPSDEPRKPSIERKKSSLFDLDIASLKNMDPTDIWKGVVQSQGLKGDIRAAEQRIAPWQEDAAVPKCPLCNASFHPLTNRKHHCRLCGQIICSLPIKRPQRLEPCSILFIVDSNTRQIEQVGEGVDYGVRRRTNGVGTPKDGKGNEKQGSLADDEKFLKGVRICRDCKPVLSREQFYQEVSSIPPLIRSYEAFIALENEIEDALPQFQELLLTLNSDSPPNKEAAAARKRILDDFASYDALSKRIRKTPCTPGSSHDRVQLAIRTRADLFLQKNMFPLQSLPKAKKQIASSDAAGPLVDPDSELAHALQPLLEQEALLESFVGEAMAHRKFEDAKTLKMNLREIRVEIDRMLENGAETPTGTVSVGIMA